MQLDLKNHFSISDLTSADKGAYVRGLQDREIHDQTLSIPFPYQESDFDGWLQRVLAESEQHGRTLNWVIREPSGSAIGGIGFHGLELGKSHRAEIGYWLAKAFWNRGIMTSAVDRVCQVGFTQLGLIRITANVFHFNTASARVLEKAGFQCEGTLRKHYKKNGRVFDGLLYARVS